MGRRGERIRDGEEEERVRGLEMGRRRRGERIRDGEERGED